MSTFKLKYIYIWSSLLIIFSGISLMLFWAFIDGVYVNRVTNKDFITYQTDKEVYYPGDSVFVKTTGLCKYRDFSAKTFLNLTDTISIPYDVKNRSIAKGCVEDDKFYLFALIPNENFLPDGVYFFNGFHKYDINPIRNEDEGIQIHFETNKFLINKHKIWVD